ncbi:MAG: tetratricopeptide repeat protein [Saprospirales bacterium]|nr:tetratricopeptide repeat protein [Saprospirales bacterium]
MMRELYEIFERYLDNELDETERADLERRLAEDAAVSAEFQKYKTIRESIQGQIGEEEAGKALAETLHGLGEEFFPQKDKIVKGIFRRYWIAAALTAAACLLLFLLPLQTDLYATYREFPTAGFTARGEQGSALLQQAEMAFNEKKYEKALPFFDAYLAQYPDQLEPLYYKGLCLLETGELTGARNIFSSIAAGPSAFAEDAQWYLALAFLREKDYESCQEALRAIAPDSMHAAKAAKLMQAIK